MGAHLEGPFLSPYRSGAEHPEHLLTPSEPVFAELADVTGPTGSVLRMITIAPELPGALELLETAPAAGVVVALGHSDATYQQAVAAITAGATVATHLFNAMRPLHHREPGLAGAALDSELFCEVINDAHHLHGASCASVRMRRESSGTGDRRDRRRRHA